MNGTNSILQVCRAAVIRLILTACFLLSSWGCERASVRELLLGTWECSDLRAIEHRAADDAKVTMVFDSEGKCTRFTTSTDGTVWDKNAASYQVEGGTLAIGSEPQTVYSVRVDSTSLRMKVEKSANPETIGFVWRFQRKR